MIHSIVKVLKEEKDLWQGKWKEHKNNGYYYNRFES